MQDTGFGANISTKSDDASLRLVYTSSGEDQAKSELEVGAQTQDALFLLGCSPRPTH